MNMKLPFSTTGMTLTLDDDLDYEISSVNNEPNVGVKLETPSERIIIDINIK